MPRIELTLRIAAPIERCFDLARSIELHARSTRATGERAVAGKTTGLLELNEEVTWRARHFGVWQTLTSRITAFDRPTYFRDSMVRGAFQRFDHDHFFEDHGGVTLMRDVFDYAAPLGILGALAERSFLTRYMRRFLEVRNLEIRAVAESETATRLFLPRSEPLGETSVGTEAAAPAPDRSGPRERRLP
jgi:ligand-binding SRPBCC domain-containing protein